MTAAYLLVFLFIFPAFTAKAAVDPSTPTAGPVVAQVQFFGLERIPEADARSRLSVREWQPYTPEMKSQDISALLDTGWFLSASIYEVALSSEAIRVDVRVKEGPPPLPAKPAEPSLAPRAEPLSSDTPSPPWVIGELEVRGNRHVKFNVVRAQIQAKKGDLYTRADLDRDIQKVYGLGNFERVTADIAALPDRELPAQFIDVSPSSHPVRLAFIVEERPLVRKIRYDGNKELSRGKVRDATETREKDPLDRVKLASDTEKILELYRKKGYHRAAAESKVDLDTAAAKADVVFLIQEGPRALIDEVWFSGVRAFKVRKVARQMKTRRKKVFSESQLEEDLKKVEAFYKDRGHIDFRIESSSVTYSEDLKRITVAVDLYEGPRYLFGDTDFSGYTIYAATDLAKAVEYRRGRVFSQTRFDYTVQNLQEMFAEKGRLRAVVQHKKAPNPATGLTDVRFEIEEGPTVYVEHVDVEGNKQTKTYVFSREIVIKPGQPFSVSKVRKSQQKIMNLGFIDDVSLDVQSPYDPNQVDLTFGVAEGKPGMLTAGAGFSSLDGLIGTLSLQHLNLFGRAWRTGVQWSFGSRVNDFSVSWTTPWLRSKPVSLGFDVFSTRRISPFEGSNAAFVNKRTGGSVRLGPRFQDDKYQLSFTYTLQKIKVTDIQYEFRDTLQGGTSIHSSFGTEFARDTRDNIWDAAEGSRNSIGTTLAGGPFMGDIHFFKPYISNQWHKSLVNIGDYPLVLSLFNRASYVTQFNETKEVPVFERFWVGGQDTLRGYSYAGQVGARDGGKVYDVANVELGFPLARERRRTIVKFVAFYDIGGSWENVRSMGCRVGQGQRDIKSDVGFGIRFTTPAFPIRLDWGYGLQHRPGEDRTEINFSIGPLF